MMQAEEAVSRIKVRGTFTATKSYITPRARDYVTFVAQHDPRVSECPYRSIVILLPLNHARAALRNKVTQRNVFALLRNEQRYIYVTLD